MELNKTSSFDKNINISLNDISTYNSLKGKNKISLIKRRDKIKTKTIDKELFLTQNNITNDIYQSKNKYIKDLITHPAIKNYIFDGYAVNRKKYSFKELINKVSKKEKGECLEKNILFKNPYPLIKFLSNRKLYNNSSSLLPELLDNNSSKLTKEQIINIKKIDEEKNNNNFNNSISNPFNYFHKNNTIFNPRNSKLNRSKNLKRNIRIYDYLNTKYNLFEEGKVNFNNIFLNQHTSKEACLPLLQKYLKDRVKNKNRNIFNMKNNSTIKNYSTIKNNSTMKSNISNKIEKKTYIIDELLKLNVKSCYNCYNFNHSINENNENYKKKCRKLISKKI